MEELDISNFDEVDPDTLLDDKELVDIELHLGVLFDENDCV